MTPDEFKGKMIQIAHDKNDDECDQHTKADELMCRVLESLGFKDGVEVFRNMKKWYQ